MSSIIFSVLPLVLALGGFCEERHIGICDLYPVDDCQKEVISLVDSIKQGNSFDSDVVFDFALESVASLNVDGVNNFVRDKFKCDINLQQDWSFHYGSHDNANSDRQCSGNQFSTH